MFTACGLSVGRRPREDRRLRLLLVEDDVEAAEAVREGLVAEGHEVHVESSGERGLSRIRTEPFDVLIVDRMLPGVDGIAVVEQARLAGCSSPVLMLTALGSIGDRVDGLRAGADDYLVKPFALAELVARIEALGRRATASAETATHGFIHLDRLRREAWRDGRRVVLQPREFELLEQLVSHGGRVVSRMMLLERVWHFNFDPQTNLVDTHMSRLRQKLNAGFDLDAIQTVRGVGYRLRDDA
jgi:two-component system, OmpR family, response regulator